MRKFFPQHIVSARVSSSLRADGPMVAKEAGTVGVVLVLLAHRWFNRGPELIRLMDLTEEESDEEDSPEPKPSAASCETMATKLGTSTLALSLSVKLGTMSASALSGNI